MTVLDDILERTEQRVAALHDGAARPQLESRATSAPAVRSLGPALCRDRIALIAEIKRRSPSAGALGSEIDARGLARLYAESGAQAVSVLTEPDFFDGSLHDLEAARDAGLPVLRKDFLIDPVQVTEARAFGADAVLVIVRVAPELVGDLISAAAIYGMDALVEVSNTHEIDVALSAGARIIGINNRDLATFEVDTGRTLELLPAIPEGVIVVALSGLSNRADVETLERAGVHAFLVGEALMRSPDPRTAIESLVGPS